MNPDGQMKRIWVVRATSRDRSTWCRHDQRARDPHEAVRQVARLHGDPTRRIKRAHGRTRYRVRDYVGGTDDAPIQYRAVLAEGHHIILAVVTETPDCALDAA